MVFGREITENQKKKKQILYYVPTNIIINANFSAVHIHDYKANSSTTTHVPVVKKISFIHNKFINTQNKYIHTSIHIQGITTEKNIHINNNYKHKSLT